LVVRKTYQNEIEIVMGKSVQEIQTRIMMAYLMRTIQTVMATEILMAKMMIRTVMVFQMTRMMI
jgi:hypothetical protein